MALLTAPFPQDQDRMVAGLIQLSAELQQRREAALAHERDQQAARAQASLQDSRRAIEFQQRLEFDRARTAADDQRQDSSLQLRREDQDFTQKQTLRDNEPLSIPGDTATGGDWKSAPATQFALVRDGKGGFMDDPQDSVDAAKGIPGYDKNKGAFGHNIKDPNLRGVALTPAEMRAAGLDPDHPNADVEVSGNGKTYRVPIVDKLGVDGKIDLTGPLFKDMGGEDSPRASIPDLKYRIVPKGESNPASQVADYLSGLQQRGIPVDRKMARQVTLNSLPSAISAQGRERVAAIKAGAGATGVATLDEQIKREGLQYNDQTRRYENEDGAEFFVGKTGGKISIKPYTPHEYAPHWVKGTDGESYPLDRKGEPMKPVPDGVELKDPGKLITRRVPNQGVYSIDRDDEGNVNETLIIPESAKMTAAESKKFVEDLGKAKDAGVQYALKKEALDRHGERTINPKTWLFGVSPDAVKEAETKAKAEKENLEQNWFRRFPALRPPEPPAPPAAPEAPSPEVAARISEGAAAAASDKVPVISPDGKPGRIPRAQLAAALQAGYKER